MPDVAMPRLSDSMEEGTILRWLKSSGDEVKRGDELVEIETDKANMTYEADQDGVLEIVADDGDTLAIGELIARIGGGGGDGGAPEQAQEDAGRSGDAPKQETGKASGESDRAAASRGEQGAAGGDASEGETASEGSRATASKARAARPTGGGSDGRVKASPIARRMAEELGVDLQSLGGSGPGGRIVKADVQAAAEGGAPAASDEAPPGPVVSGEPGKAKGEVRAQDLSRTQQVIARRMAEAKATVPEFTLQAEVDMDRAVELRSQLKAVPGDNLTPSFNDMIVKACALALREFPRANGAYRDGHFELFSRVNVGVAVAAQDALVVPTVFDADRKALGEIARDARALAERVRAGAITPPELSGATFTVSNLGMYGVSNFTAIINPPQAAILAVGAVRETPVVRDGQIVPGHRMGVTLACDHRILYGADAAEFLARIRALLEQPLALAL